MKKKAALMKNVKYNFLTVKIIESDTDINYWTGDDEFVFISEVIEIDFPELDNQTVINNHVAVIEKQITKVRADSEASITALNKRKQELLAITYEASE
ncbi:MAG: hypothetical protein PF444_08310 [Bacteroidales bacterium]|jgi:hypothetical protein|nr:hypothetical protein [Bacteroidales bacterium]